MRAGTVSIQFSPEAISDLLRLEISVREMAHRAIDNLMERFYSSVLCMEHDTSFFNVETEDKFNVEYRAYSDTFYISSIKIAEAPRDKDLGAFVVSRNGITYARRVRIGEKGLPNGLMLRAAIQVGCLVVQPRKGFASLPKTRAGMDGVNDALDITPRVSIISIDAYSRIDRTEQGTHATLKDGDLNGSSIISHGIKDIRTLPAEAQVMAFFVFVRHSAAMLPAIFEAAVQVSIKRIEGGPVSYTFAHSRRSLECFPPKWSPVLREEARYDKGLETDPIATRSGTALAKAIPAWAEGAVLLAGNSHAGIAGEGAPACASWVIAGIGGATAACYAAVLFLGTNDILHRDRPLTPASVMRFRADAARVLSWLQARAARVAVAAVPPIGATAARKLDPAAVAVYSAELYALCPAPVCWFADPFAGLRDGASGLARAGALTDGLHLADYPAMLAALELCPVDEAATAAISER